jgi:hypothetical protein
MGTDIIEYGDSSPGAIVRNATEVATLLTTILREQNLVANISGKEHVLVEGWTLLASMMNHSVGTAGTEAVTVDGHAGFMSHAVVYDREGNVVGSADGVCTRGERAWSGRDDYALSGMAQTRAISRACRQRFGFVVRLAGYEPTPAEEMGFDRTVISREQVDELVAIVREGGIDPVIAKGIVKKHAGVDSSQDIPVEKFDTVKAMLTATALGGEQE